jgi:putative colanic acid biosynthesis UDP-glucose lipid carrier transferase
MSVVGPRPLAQYDVDMLMDSSPENFRRLLAVRPGITSLGQLKFGYATNQKENVQRMTYDLLYLKKYSFTTDLWLIYLTAKVMVQGKGK